VKLADLKNGNGHKYPLAANLIMLALRLSLASMMLTLAFRLMFEGGWNAWTVVGHLVPQTVRGPFAGLFYSFWENPIVLALVIGSSLAVGMALFVGLFVRLAAIGGALMMIGFYVATLPPEFGWINEQLIFALTFLAYAVMSPAYNFGLDSYLKKLETRYPVLRFVIG
jgi:thiosulfate dehydrogenase [quinone] large subunit